MDKTAPTDRPLHELLTRRWSPRAFQPEPVSPDDLALLLEAARWAPSSYNEQPWRYLVASREDRAGFERLAGCLVEGNAWAREAPLLALAAARTTFERNGKPNAHAWHDVGLANAHLTLQATALGLAVHLMAGFDAGAARERLAIPEGFDPVVMLAVGFPGDPDQLPAPLAEAERAPRTRRPLSEIAFAASWGEPLHLPAPDRAGPGSSPTE